MSILGVSEPCPGWSPLQAEGLVGSSPPVEFHKAQDSSNSNDKTQKRVNASDCSNTFQAFRAAYLLVVHWLEQAPRLSPVVETGKWTQPTTGHGKGEDVRREDSGMTISHRRFGSFMGTPPPPDHCWASCSLCRTLSRSHSGYTLALTPH